MNRLSAFAGANHTSIKVPFVSPHILSDVAIDEEPKVAPGSMKFLQRAISAHAAQLNTNQVLHAETVALGQQVESLQNECDVLQIERDFLVEETKTLKQSNGSLLSYALESNGLLLMADTRIAEVETALADARTEVIDWKAKEEDITTRYQQLEGLYSVKEFQLNATEMSLASTETRITTLEAELAEARSEADEHEAVRNDLAFEQFFNSDKIMTLENDLDAARKEKAALTTKFEAELASAKSEKEALVRQLEKTAEDFNHLEHEAKASQVALDIARIELDANQHALTIAQEQADTYEGEARSTQIALDIARIELDANQHALTIVQEEAETYEREARTSQATLEITRIELEANQTALTVAQEQADSYEIDKVLLEARADGLSAKVDTLAVALHASEERAKTAIGESMASLHLEQEKTKALEGRLAESKELLVSAAHNIDTLQEEVSELQAEVTSVRGDLFEKQLEVELLTQQEQEAMDALKVEERSRAAAEKERDDMAVRMAELLAEMEAMKAQQQALQEHNARLEDQNEVFRMQLTRECDAHASTRDDMDRMQARLCVVINEKENQSVAAKPPTPARSNSIFLRRQRTPLQSRNVDPGSPLPSRGSVSLESSSVQIDDSQCYTRENSPIQRSPTTPLASPIGFSLQRRSSSTASSYRSFPNRLFRRASPDSSTASPRTDSEFFISPALS